MRWFIFFLVMMLMACGSFVAGETSTMMDGGAREPPSPLLPDGEADSRSSFIDESSGESPYERAVKDDHPIAYWRFEETTGSTAKDEVGAHQATARGLIEWQNKGAVGRGVRLDGRGCWDAGLVSGLEGAFTVEAWISVVLPNRILLSQGWDLRFSDTPAKAVFEVGAGLGVAVSNRTVEASTFTHVVASTDGVAAYVYVDGVADGHGPASVFGPETEHLLIGCDSRGPFQGLVDEVAVYGYALSPERVATHFALAR